AGMRLRKSFAETSGEDDVGNDGMKAKRPDLGLLRRKIAIRDHSEDGIRPVCEIASGVGCELYIGNMQAIERDEPLDYLRRRAYGVSRERLIENASAPAAIEQRPACRVKMENAVVLANPFPHRPVTAESEIALKIQRIVEVEDDKRLA